MRRNTLTIMRGGTTRTRASATGQWQERKPKGLTVSLENLLTAFTPADPAAALRAALPVAAAALRNGQDVLIAGDTPLDLVPVWAGLATETGVRPPTELIVEPAPDDPAAPEDKLVGALEIAARFGVGRPTVDGWLADRPGRPRVFPPHDDYVSGRPLWRRSTVDAFGVARGKPPVADWPDTRGPGQGGTAGRVSSVDG